MKRIVFLLLLAGPVVAMAQPTRYTPANAHSHNDYEKPAPFRAAYQAGFGSLEADLHLINDTLWVGHNTARPGINPTFDSLYLRPLNAAVARNRGLPYAHPQQLQVLIDLKTAALPTLQKVVAALQKYPALVNNPHIRFVISGSRPNPSTWPQYPTFIWFDGNLGQEYSAAALSKIALMSASFTKFTSWKGEGPLPAAAQDTLQQLITRAHALKKPVRFWASPDQPNAWNILMQLKVDYINTDRITELAAFLRQKR